MQTMQHIFTLCQAADDWMLEVYIAKFEEYSLNLDLCYFANCSKDSLWVT